MASVDLDLMLWIQSVAFRNSAIQPTTYNDFDADYDFLQVELERNTSVTPSIWNEDSAVPVDEETVSTIGYGTIDILTFEIYDVLLEAQLQMINQEGC